ncbi:MAG: cytochrome c biogenesis protein CcsA [Planctomycetes bacterium]|nr:cytochrome c biogenesis protein CcsA [Planctomycetota bacterium]
MHTPTLLSRCWLLLLLFAAACSRPAPKYDGELERTEPWPAEFVTAFGALPLMHEGRTMPFSTLAASTLYAVHGRRDVQFVSAGKDGVQTVKLSPTEWLLDVWCFPKQSGRYPLFRIENVGVLSALGFEHGGQKQGFEYLSYAELLPVGEKLEELAEAASGKHQSVRSPVESHVANLFHQLLVYHRLHRQHEALQGSFPVEGEPMRAVVGSVDRVSLAVLLQKSQEFRTLVREAGEQFEDPKYGNLSQVLQFVSTVAQTPSGPQRVPMVLPPLLPPAEKDAWHPLSQVVDAVIRGAGEPGTKVEDAKLRAAADPKLVAMIADLQAGLLAPTMAERVRHLDSFRAAVVAAATARGELGKVALESYYYGANWHFHAMMTFVLAFVLAVGACVLPRNRILWWAGMVTSGGALAMLVADVWLRCVITSHPPIGRLYDTFLFIGGTGALALLIAEAILRRRFALVLAPLLGALMILLARLFEVADGADTMRPLQAVLLSNFWLAVHVPTMNLGYAGGVAAALVGCAWVVVRAARIDHPDGELAKSLYRVNYGVTCFGLATAVVGTILGGVWANDSWGRFWGWDPKENGAMLVCLSQIALLHARMCGMVRDAGFALWSVATGIIVVFSWFHTNLLGVGLHAYGFSSALLTGVWISYTFLGLFLVVGGLDVLLRPKPAPITRPGHVPALPTEA